MDEPFSIAIDRPLLTVTFREPQRVLSWSMLRPGIQAVRRIAWLEVRNADLPANVDAFDVISGRIRDAGLDDAVVLVTSRDIRRNHFSHVRVEDTRARCLTTVGLSNSERVGVRLHRPPPLTGTINTLVHVEHPLTDGALIEAMSIATEARTAAVLDADVRRGGLAVTGTGTDCIAITAPVDGEVTRYAGKHTALGEAIGAAVYRATAEGIADWKTDYAEISAPADAPAAP